jgi:hypothetical protein
VGTAFGWIEWLSNGTGHRFLASYAFYFQSEIPNISLLPKPHPFYLSKKVTMAKVKTTFYCQNCGAQHARWQGNALPARDGTRSWKVVEKSSTSWSSLQKESSLSRSELKTHNASR